MKKDERKSLKGPDVLQKGFFDLANWVTTNQMIFVKVFALAAVVILSGLGWFWYEGRQTDARLEALAAIDEELRTEEFNTYDRRRELNAEIGRLQEQLQELNKDVKKNAGSIEVLKGSIASKENLFANLKPELSGVTEKYLQFFEQHQNSIEGLRAGVKAAGQQIQEEEYQKAADLLAKILVSAPKNPFYELQVRTVYIAVLEQLGNFEEALKQASALVQAAPQQFSAKALYTKGRVELLAGDKKSADSTFEELIAKHANSGEAQKARALQAIWN